MKGGHRLPGKIGIVETRDAEGEVVYAARLPGGPIVVLRDTALQIWQEAVAPSGEGALAERVADLYGVPVDEIEPVVDSCVTALVGQGVLEIDPSA